MRLRGSYWDRFSKLASGPGKRRAGVLRQQLSIQVTLPHTYVWRTLPLSRNSGISHWICGSRSRGQSGAERLRPPLHWNGSVSSRSTAAGGEQRITNDRSRPFPSRTASAPLAGADIRSEA